MLPSKINGLIFDIDIVEKDVIGRNSRAEYDYEQACIEICKMQPDRQSRSLMHELVHHCLAVSRGLYVAFDGHDEEAKGERVARTLGEVLPKVLEDNPDLLQRIPESVSILGVAWSVVVTDYPNRDDDDAAWLMDPKRYRFILGARSSEQVQLLRLFSLICQAILLVCDYGEDAYDDQYAAMFPVLFAVLKANPQAHPLAVKSQEPVTGRTGSDAV